MISVRGDARPPRAVPRADLVKDDFRCIVFGRYDYRSVSRIRELSEEEQYTETRVPTCLARCGHGLPRADLSVSANISDSDADKGDTAGNWKT